MATTGASSQSDERRAAQKEQSSKTSQAAANTSRQHRAATAARSQCNDRGRTHVKVTSAHAQESQEGSTRKAAPTQHITSTTLHHMFARKPPTQTTMTHAVLQCCVLKPNGKDCALTLVALQHSHALCQSWWRTLPECQTTNARTPPLSPTDPRKLSNPEPCCTARCCATCLAKDGLKDYEHQAAHMDASAARDPSQAHNATRQRDQAAPHRAGACRVPQAKSISSSPSSIHHLPPTGTGTSMMLACSQSASS